MHLLGKGRNIHDAEERAEMSAKKPNFVIVLDQGSRLAPPIIDDPDARTLVIDHHLSDEFPENAMVSYLSASR